MLTQVHIRSVISTVMTLDYVALSTSLIRSLVSGPASLSPGISITGAPYHDDALHLHFVPEWNRTLWHAGNCAGIWDARLLAVRFAGWLGTNNRMVTWAASEVSCQCSTHTYSLIIKVIPLHRGLPGAMMRDTAYHVNLSLVRLR